MNEKFRVKISFCKFDSIFPNFFKEEKNCLETKKLHIKIQRMADKYIGPSCPKPRLKILQIME